MSDQMLFADGFDDAIVGVDVQSSPMRVIYDRQAMVAILMTEEGMTYEDAIDHLEYNVWNAYVGEGTPMYVYMMNKGNIAELRELGEDYF